MTKGVVSALVIYYVVFIIISLLILISTLIDEFHFYDNVSILSKSILAAIFTASMGSSIFYLRKLYKACINLDIEYSKSEEDKLRQLGVILYFVFRPIFSMCFAVVMIVFFKSGMCYIAETHVVNERFFHISILIAFFVGYSSGDLINKLEEKGKSLIAKSTN